MLDVGQGSGLYLRTSGGEEILIDTGETHKTLRELGALRNPLDRHIDHIFITHADRDHIGRLPELLERYSVGAVYQNEREEYDAVSGFLSEHPAEKQLLHAGDVFVIDGLAFEVLWPIEREVFGNKNDGSLVMKITIGNQSILTTGDISKKVEKRLVDMYGDTLQSDVLLVAHHGSKNSTSDIFLDAVRPSAALISVGEDNRYGHPHRDVLEILLRRGIEIFRTDRMGTILFTSDNNDLRVLDYTN